MKTLLGSETAGVGEWTVVHDDVMGGRSSGTVAVDAHGVAQFRGHLSLENGGGFASARGRIHTGSMTGASHVVLRVRGDGRSYELRLRPDGRFGQIAFRAGFNTTAGEWMVVRLPLNTFEPTLRGRRPDRVALLDLSQIGQLAIMLADGQEGPFRLEIDWIAVD